MQKNCTSCTKEFQVMDDELKFLEKVSPEYKGKKYNLPPSELCPPCRERERMGFRNERNLYKRTCDLCSKEIISIYSPDKTSIVYCNDCYRSDKWDGTTSGRDYDFSKTFFEQFKSLADNIPHLPIFATNNQNSDYTNGSQQNKDCYMIFVSDHNQNCYYSDDVFDCDSSMDLLGCSKCQLAYQCIGCTGCYDSKYLIDCHNCRDSDFCLDCKNCENCYFSFGLRNKKYHFLNKPLSKEEYEKKVEQYKSMSPKDKQKYLLEQTIKMPHLFIHGMNNADSTGDYISNCKNSLNCYGSHYLEDCKSLLQSNKAKDCREGYVVVDNSELCYQVMSSISQNKCVATNLCWNNNDLLYCFDCENSSNLFGCVGLKRKKYCILNKQYTQEEYEELMPKIIEQMRKTNEWGKYFPAGLTSFAYNETVANDYYPLNKEEAIKRGYSWKEADNREFLKQSYNVPSDINQVPDSILQEVLACKDCGKNYKIIPQELSFYKKRGVPVPEKCHDCRHAERLKIQNPRTLFDRKCDKCGMEMQTTYAPDRPETVYCEKCYLSAVY